MSVITTSKKLASAPALRKDQKPIYSELICNGCGMMLKATGKTFTQSRSLSESQWYWIKSHSSFQK